MFDRKSYTALAVGALILALAVSGCDRIGFPPRRPTQPPPPTDTPPPPIVQPPTSTPTPVPPTETPTLVLPTPTLTLPPEATAEPEPTAVPEPTDTPQPTPNSTPTSPPPPPTPIPESTELLKNGNFEEGFTEDGVAVGWHKFSNGNAAFGWHDDTWELVVWEGEHSQLLSIIDPSLNDRFVGIYQSVNVVPDKAYELTLRGLVRANTPPEQYGHRLYWGVDDDGSTDWQAVENWVELPWDQQPRVAKAFTVNDYTTVITPTGRTLTLFVRGHSKWQRQSEANFNLDGLSLKGVPGAAPGQAMPVTGRADGNWIPIAALILLVLILFREGWRGVDWFRREA